MKIIKEYGFEDLYKASWIATNTLIIISKNNMENELMEHLENIFSDQIPTLTEINDYLWFKADYIFECLGINVED